MKVFMFNHSGSLNRGCEAIVRGTINILDRTCQDNKYLLSSYNPQEDIFIEDLSELYAFKPEALNKAAHLQAAVRIKLINDERYSVIKCYSDFFEQADRADICLSIGGDTYCYGDNAVIRILTGELKKRSKSVVLWGASIGTEDLTPEKEKNLVCVDAIFVRESISYNLLKSRNLNKKIFLFPDPAFTLRPEELPLPGGWQEQNTLGINISPIVTQANPALMKIISGFIEHLIKNTDLSIALIPHATSSSNNDMTVLNDLFRENAEMSKGRLLVLPGNLTAAQYKGYIARLRFFIAARTHASIAAYSSMVPAIVLGYSVKSRGIAQDIFCDERFILDAGNISTLKELTDILDSLTEQENEIKNMLNKNIPDIIKKAYSAGDKLVEI